jgi:hypothetical protein
MIFYKILTMRDSSDKGIDKYYEYNDVIIPNPNDKLAIVSVEYFGELPLLLIYISHVMKAHCYINVILTECLFSNHESPINDSRALVRLPSLTELNFINSVIVNGETKSFHFIKQIPGGYLTDKKVKNLT